MRGLKNRDGGPAAIPPSFEVWRDIPGYEGAYQVSSLGRVRSLPRMIPVFNSRKQRLQFGIVFRDNDHGTFS